MNRMKWMFMLVIGALFLLTSCKKEEDEILICGPDPWICVIEPVEDSIVCPLSNQIYIDGEVNRAMEVGVEGPINYNNK